MVSENENIDMAHLWLQDEVKSNRLKVRRDEGTQQQHHQKACDIHGVR